MTASRPIRDAKKLAELLESGRLQANYIPTPEEELARQFQRTRDQLMRERVRIGTRLRVNCLSLDILVLTMTR